MRRSDSRWTVVPGLAACLAVLAGCGGGGGDGGGGGGNGGTPAPPTVTTLTAQMASATEQAVSGTVNPNGSETEAWFEWGADETFASASRTAASTLPASTTAQTVSAKIGSLRKGDHFHYRAVARNAAGTVQGAGRACHHYANVVFVTSATGTGNLGGWAEAGGKTGLAAGDAICQTLAERAGLPGTFKAWLSDATTAARDRLARSAEAYLRVDGVRIADSWSDLTPAQCVQGGSCIDAPISVDERGGSAATAPPASGAYTDTRWDGSKGTGALGTNACASWTSAGTADRAAGGYSYATNYQWTEAGQNTCQFARPLYCFQQNLDLPQEMFDTGCPGPIGWVWHVSACSNGLYQDPECRYVCCNFYAPTGNCGTIPVTFNGYTVSSCSYNTGVYSMGVSHAGRTFTVSCEVD